MIDQIEHNNAGSYPPYNIIAVNDDEYVIEIAIAGFDQNEITVTAQHGELRVEGTKTETEESEGPNYLHRGISARRFQRTFNLADYVEVQSAQAKDGILTIGLQRQVPDALKPKQIEVTTA
jgi:molecular chaperone IbpA